MSLNWNMDREEFIQKVKSKEYKPARDGVIALLKEPNLTYAEIRRGLNISRERVRKIASTIGVNRRCPEGYRSRIETEKILGLSRDQVLRQIHRGKLNAIKVRNIWCVKIEKERYE